MCKKTIDLKEDAKREFCVASILSLDFLKDSIKQGNHKFEVKPQVERLIKKKG